ncbi:MAG: efflux RND transporter permease subunit [Chthonomonas sp.]|nr:efflux RND transporter permease subunit [Chthonomonas sp.]
MGLTKLAITRPIFIFMLMCLAVFGGLFASCSMRVEDNPEVQFGVVTISTVYPGAGPEEINTLISRRVEEAISGVNGLLELTSTSQEGVSIVVANFEIGTNMDAALNDVRSKVDGIVSELPQEALAPSVSKIDSASEPIVTMSLSSDRLSPRELRTLTDDKIADRFARIKGVAQVEVSGGEEREIQVRVKKDRLVSYGIGIADVQRAIAQATLNVPAGRVVSPDEEISVRVLGEFKSTEDIKNTIIRISDPKEQGSGASVRLSDIAEVVDTQAEKRQFDLVDGKPSVIVSIQKAREGNAVQIAGGVHAMTPALEKEFGVKFVTTQDTSIQVAESVDDLKLTLIIGIILVTAIIYLFLHNLRGTLIVAIAIPVCLLATFIVLAITGNTLNNMTLLAMSLAIGVLVDDSIVVLENIYRHLQMGEDPTTAAINGRGEIGLAAIAITLADVVVFLPMAFMGGVVGQFFRPLGIAFAAAVMISLFVSFTVTPMLASRWYKEGEDVEHQGGKFARWFDGRFEALQETYARGLEWALNRRWFVFISGFVLLLGVGLFIGGGSASSPKDAVSHGGLMGIMMITMVVAAIGFVCNLLFMRKFRPRVLWGAVLFALVFPLFSFAGYQYAQWKGSALFGVEFVPPTDQGNINVTAELAPNATLEQTQAVVKKLEAIVAKHPEVHTYVTKIGSWSGTFGGAGGSSGSNLASIRIKLKDRTAILDKLTPWINHHDKTRSQRDTSVVADLTASIGKVTGAKVNVAAAGGFAFGAPIQMSFASDNRELLAKTTSRIVSLLSDGAIKGVISPEVSSKPGKPEYRAIPDRDRMADAGVSTSDIAMTMRMLYEGNDDVKLRELGREYPIRVMMDLDDRNNPDLISQVPVTFSQGSPVYLPQVARLEPGVTVDKVERRNRQEEIRITANLLPGFAAGTVQDEITAWIKKEQLLPEGITKKDLGQADAQQRETLFLFQTLFIGLFLVYMVLASLYDNLLYPFIIQLAQPQAFVGALLALVLTDKSLNIVGFIGLIALVGLVGKNAILLVDYANTMRGRGENRHDALVSAGRTRLRPIMMTTLAVILGMFPVALAIGRGSEFRETLGIIIIGGIALSTMLTLLVIPCSYTIFDDMSNLLTRWMGRKPAPSELLKRD